MLFLWPLLLATASADDSLGCFSSIDTSVSKGYNAYQTSSICALSCGTDYAYVAVKDGGYCYCLLSLPTTTTSSSSCNVVCNGYGSVMCGGTSAYSVFAGEGVASASDSAAASSGTSTSSSTSSTSSASLSSLSTAKTSSTSSSATTVSPSSLQVDSTSAPDTTLSATSSNTSLVVTTSTNATGQITKTVTATSSSTASSGLKSSSSGKSTKKSNTGAIVGGVVGGLAAVILIAVGVFFFMRYRNSDDEDDEEEFYDKNTDGVTRGTGTAKSKKNFASAFDMPMANPFVHPSDEFADKRASRMTASELADPRLNPTMMGRRRLSEGSLADETDYSRKILGVANP